MKNVEIITKLYKLADQFQANGFLLLADDLREFADDASCRMGSAADVIDELTKAQ